MLGRFAYGRHISLWRTSYADNHKTNGQPADGVPIRGTGPSQRSQVREILDGALTLDIRALSLDLSGITFMDSSGIGVILGRYRIMRERGGTLRVSA